MRTSSQRGRTRIGRALRSIALMAAFLLPVTPAVALSYPERAVTIIVTNAPGGSTDLVARIVADDLTKRLGQTFVVENRPGAGGNIATRAVANSKADGYTILLTSNNHTINPLLYKDAGYALEDLVPLAKLTDSPLVVVVPADSPHRTLEGLIDEARQQPEKIAYGSSGIGFSPHIAGQMLMERAGVKLLHVPFKGSGASLVALYGGQLPMAISSLAAIQPYIQTGKLRALAITSKEPWPTNAEIPPVAKTLQGYEYLTWFGLFLPKGTPDEIVRKLNAELRASLSSPETRTKIEQQGISVAIGTPEEFAKNLEAEYNEARKLISTIGLSQD